MYCFIVLSYDLEFYSLFLFMVVWVYKVLYIVKVEKYLGVICYILF